MESASARISLGEYWLCYWLVNALRLQGRVNGDNVYC